MSNTSIPAGGEAMPDASIYLLLATYWQRMDELTVAMVRTDETESGTPDHQAAFAAQGEAGDRLTEAEVKIAGFVPERKYDAQIKASFLTLLAESNHGRLEAEVTSALLTSLHCLVDWRAPA